MARRRIANQPPAGRPPRGQRLLFTTRDGRGLWAVNPILAFSGLGAVTRIPALRRRNHAGTINAATMIYDQLPVNDVFRKLDDHSVLGAMDLRGSKKPYFFVLTRDDSLRLQLDQGQ